ncbi:MAG: transcription termination factor NusA [Kiritimatiellae bacterium]|jgi:N utilization substance protein A|nr:transcription termination factor NusA [Kiritimatiellia bacterium]
MAMNSQLLAVVQHIESERGVSREIVLQAIEQAISQAARKNRDVTNDLRVVIDRKDLSLHVFDTLVASDEDTGPGFISIARATRANHGKPVAEGETIEIEMPASRLGRIAAQTSRQMIMQKIREAERTNTFSEYKDRVGDIISGTVSAVSHRDVYVTVGKTEMILPGKERIPTEDFQVGDPIRAIILRVVSSDDKSAKGPSVVLSRASGKFVEALFRLEVSEIADGVVEIMGVSRDPGYRAKLAVRTSNENVDPVGACVGQRGSRVRAIVNELNGEKIDIVRWNDDIRQYVAQALAPAKLESIEVDPVLPNTVHVVAAADQYSLAIGKRGQNVRLTTKLTGWHVEIRKSMATASFEDQKAAAIKELAETFSVSTAVATQMADAGFLSVDGIVGEDEASFIAATGLDEVTAKGIYAAAQAVAKLMAGEEAISE